MSSSSSSNSALTVFRVKGSVNYDQVCTQFGLQKIDESLLQRFASLIHPEPVHPWLKRGIFFCQRSLEQILDAKEKGQPIYLYTGRGPSSVSQHVGHLIPFWFTVWLQKVLQCPVVIQISDDEKYFVKPDSSFQEIQAMGEENKKDILAYGFIPEKTFLFFNREYRLSTPTYESFVSELMKQTCFRDIKKIFGVDQADNIGTVVWPLYQVAPVFAKSFPHLLPKNALCLVAYAIDQDPYFRLARDLAHKLKLPKPASIVSSFLPPLKGVDKGKMSSSVDQETTIFLTDTPDMIQKKMKKFAFSGGGKTLEEHRTKGGNLDLDIAYQYLKFFEFDDAKLDQIAQQFQSGQMSSSEIKQFAATKLSEIISTHKEKRN